MSKTNAVVYPEFNVCLNFTFDNYWREIFSNCSKGTFPKGMKYDQAKHTLYVKPDLNSRQNQHFILDINDAEGSKIYKVCMHIFRNILNMRSDQDIKLSCDELEKIREKNEVDLDCEWKKLKPRSIKNQLLMNFAIALVNEYDLKSNQAKHIYGDIQLGFRFKQLTSDDVEYSNGTVISINGLEFDSEKKTFILTHIPKTVSRVEKPPQRNNRLNQTITKWSKNYKNNY